MSFNLLYLDIDGVLNTYDDFEILLKSDFKNNNFLIYDTGHFICLNKLKILKKFIIDNDLKVVIVSSWVVRLKSALNVCNFLDLPYYSEPLSSSGGFQRESSIKEHIEENKIEKYLIIDDAGSKCYKSKKNLLTVNGRVGLTCKDLCKIKNIYNFC